jgi:hypothetical protein
MSCFISEVGSRGAPQQNDSRLHRFVALRQGLQALHARSVLKITHECYRCRRVGNLIDIRLSRQHTTWLQGKDQEGSPCSPPRSSAECPSSPLPGPPYCSIRRRRHLSIMWPRCCTLTHVLNLTSHPSSFISSLRVTCCATTLSHSSPSSSAPGTSAPPLVLATETRGAREAMEPSRVARREVMWVSDGPAGA